MKKRLLSLFFSLVLCLGLLPTGVAALEPVILIKNPFTDVTDTSHGYSSSVWAYYAGVTTGTGKGLFSPKGTCTRAQVVTFLWRALASPEPAPTTNPFTDVKTSDYFYKAAMWAVEKGVTSGTSATTFSPNDDCSNAQVFTFLWRANGMPEPSTLENNLPAYEERFPGQYYTKALAWGLDKKIGIYLPSQRKIDTKEHISSPCLRQDLVDMLYTNAGYPDVLQYGTKLAKFTSSIPKRFKSGEAVEVGDMAYFVSANIEGTEVLTMGEKGKPFTFTPEGTMLLISNPTKFDPIQLPNGDYGQYFESPDYSKVIKFFAIGTRDNDLSLDIAGAEDREGAWMIAYSPHGTVNQHFDVVEAPKDAAGNIRAYIKSIGGNYVTRTKNGIELTQDKAKATPFYFIKATQTAALQPLPYL